MLSGAFEGAVSAGIFVRKLEMFEPLSDEDRVFLLGSLSRTRSVPANTDLAIEGDVPGHLHIVIEGLACRYKRLKNGRRQITSFLLPGDFADLHAVAPRKMDHSVGCLSASRVAVIDRQRVTEMTERPAIARSLIFAGLVDDAVLREWVANLGQRNASEKMAHLFCELFFRLRFVGLVLNEASFDLPVTQAELADTLGLSLVHTNKSLKKLRDLGLITFRQQTLTIHDMEGLRAFGGFEGGYLHLAGGVSTISRNDP